MKALLATMAIVVIATCGYFVYDDRKSKAAEAAAVWRLDCLKTLRSLRDDLKEVNMWDGKTHEERVNAFKTHPNFTKYEPIYSNNFDGLWKECGW
ncbi:hypothetical protein N9P99_00490 [Planktomarina temperata]|nr:hypothetical protein [Planktomarina temperata]